MDSKRILLYASLFAWIAGGLLLALRWWGGWMLAPPVVVLLPMLFAEVMLLSTWRVPYAEEPLVEVRSQSAEIILAPHQPGPSMAGLIVGWSLFLVAWIVLLVLIFPTATAAISGLLALGALKGLVALSGRQQGARYRSRLLVDHHGRTLLVGAADALLPLGDVMDVVVEGDTLQVKTLDAAYTLPAPGAPRALLLATAEVLREQARPFGAFQAIPADREAMNDALRGVREKLPERT